jgi:hypothetical protein
MVLWKRPPKGVQETMTKILMTKAPVFTSQMLDLLLHCCVDHLNILIRICFETADPLAGSWHFVPTFSCFEYRILGLVFISHATAEAGGFRAIEIRIS